MASYTIVCYNVISLFVYHGSLPLAMGAILATVANGEQATVDTNREAGRNKLISHLIYTLILNPLMAASPKPFCRGSWGWGVFHHRNHDAGEANGSIMVGMFVCCVFP
jgi:hypothetical protein